MPLVAEANQMSEELKKVRASERHDVRSRKDLGEPLTPTAPKWLHATDRDIEAWRGEVLCPGPYELVTESRPTPRPSQPRPLGAIPSTSGPPRPTRPPGPQTNIPSQIVLQGGLSGYLDGFYVTKKSLVTRDPNHQETHERLHHSGEAYRCWFPEIAEEF